MIGCRSVELATFAQNRIAAMAIRVLVVSNYDDNYNAVRPEGELFIGLQQAGLDVHVMTFGHTPFAERFREAGIRVIDFHPAKKFDQRAQQLIRQEMIDHDRQILHLFNNKAIINGIKAVRDLPVKVLTYRGYTGNIHWWDPTNYLTHLNPRIDAISCVSDAVKEVFERQLFFPAGKAVTISKGHNPAWYANVETGDLSEFDLPTDAIVVSVVANARRMKGIPYLLQAMKELSLDLPLYFLFIGRGLDNAVTIKELERINWRSRAIFAGFRRDVLELVKACDLSVLPSVKGEGLSKVLLESLFLGRPTIMTDIAGNRGLAVSGETGLVVPARDPYALAKAITSLAENADLRQEMGAAGKNYISEHYTVERSVGEMKALYEDLIKNS